MPWIAACGCQRCETCEQCLRAMPASNAEICERRDLRASISPRNAKACKQRQGTPRLATSLVASGSAFRVQTWLLFCNCRRRHSFIHSHPFIHSPRSFYLAERLHILLV